MIRIFLLVIILILIINLLMLFQIHYEYKAQFLHELERNERLTIMLKEPCRKCMVHVRKIGTLRSILDPFLVTIKDSERHQILSDLIYKEKLNEE